MAPLILIDAALSLFLSLHFSLFFSGSFSFLDFSLDCTKQLDPRCFMMGSRGRLLLGSDGVGKAARATLGMHEYASSSLWAGESHSSPPATGHTWVFQVRAPYIALVHFCRWFGENITQTSCWALDLHPSTPEGRAGH